MSDNEDLARQTTFPLKSRKERRKLAKELGQDFVAISGYVGSRDPRLEVDGDNNKRLSPKYIRKGRS